MSEGNVLWTSTARASFEHALIDVDILLGYGDERFLGPHNRPDRDLGVLRRAGVILVVTAWESYIEDTLRHEFGKRLNDAATPGDMESAFNKVANWWLSSEKNPLALVPNLSDWTGLGWKDLLRTRLESELDALNTPSSGTIAALSKAYLGEDVTSHWRWRGTSTASACARLDRLIRLRGRLVHHGKDLFERRQSARRADVVEGRDLVGRLAQSTDSALGIAPWRAFG